MEYRGRFARVIDDVIIDVIVVDDVCNVATTCSFSFDSLLLSWIQV